MSDESVLHCVGITRQYDAETTPLAGVDFRCGIGEFIAITGPSGAGKSTLLNVLGLLDRADSGEYRVGGAEVAALSPDGIDDLRGSEFGFVFQAAHLIPGRTVAQNLDAALQYSGLPTDERVAAIEASLAQVGMTPKTNSTVDALSGGERQRVAIARALAHGPRVVFMDEPTGNLDDGNTESVVALIEGLSAGGITVIVVTHDDRVSRRASRILRLAEGRLTEPAPPARPVAGQHERMPRPPRRAVRAGRLLRDAVFGVGARRFRAAMSLLIVALGTAALVVASGLSITATQQVDESIRSAMGSTVRAQFDEEHDATSDPDTIEPALRAIGELDGVTATAVRWDVPELAGAVSRTSELRQGDLRRQVRLIVVGGDFFATSNLTVVPANSATLVTRFDAPPGMAVIGHEAAEALGIGGAGAGQVFWIGDRQLSVVGLLAPSPAGGEGFDDAIVVGYPTGTEVAASIPPGQYVVTTELGMAPAVARVLPLVLEPAHPEWVGVETTAQLTGLRSTIGAQLGQLATAVAVVLVALAVLVTSAITMAGVTARRSEIALRRAVGARRSEVAALLVTESAIVGLGGGILGVAIGQAVIVAGSALLGWTPVLSPTALAVGPLVGVAVAAGAAILPALRSASIQPALELHAV